MINISRLGFRFFLKSREGKKRKIEYFGNFWKELIFVEFGG